jgi:hypothetical protein
MVLAMVFFLEGWQKMVTYFCLHDVCYHLTVRASHRAGPSVERQEEHQQERGIAKSHGKEWQRPRNDLPLGSSSFVGHNVQQRELPSFLLSMGSRVDQVR